MAFKNNIDRRTREISYEIETTYNLVLTISVIFRQCFPCELSCFTLTDCKKKLAHFGNFNCRFVKTVEVSMHLDFMTKVSCLVGLPLFL